MLETEKKEIDSRLKDIGRQLSLANKQFNVLIKLELKTTMLVEYKELLEEALSIGNKELIESLKRRINILEAKLASYS